MIVLHRQRAVVITPPRCASTTLRVLLPGPVFGGELLPRSDPWWVAQHSCFPPEGTEDYRVFLAIREPVARGMSMFRHGREEVPDAPSVTSFARFVELLTTTGPSPWEEWRRSCLDHLLVNPTLAPRLAGLLRVDRLAVDLRQLDPLGPFDLPQENASPDEAVIMSEELGERLRRWGASDLALIALFKGP